LPPCHEAPKEITMTEDRTGAERAVDPARRYPPSDLVRLRYGGPLMEVVAVEDSGIIECAWVEGGSTFRRDHFAAHQLAPAWSRYDDVGDQGAVDYYDHTPRTVPLDEAAAAADHSEESNMAGTGATPVFDGPIGETLDEYTLRTTGTDTPTDWEVFGHRAQQSREPQPRYEQPVDGVPPAPGDVVLVRSGGPLMVVAFVTDSAVTAFWQGRHGRQCGFDFDPQSVVVVARLATFRGQAFH
jgi:uncharacterized protein YodC (DUF2158 family)